MRTPIVAGNWKMNGDPDSVKFLTEGLIETVAVLDGVEVVVFPPFVFLEQVRRLSVSVNGKGRLRLGGQNCDWHEAGAYTGEVSAGMLASSGCQYVLTGHSERRMLYGDTSEKVAMKFAAIHKAGMTPVLCVGETSEERKQGRTREVVLAQLEAVLAQTGNRDALTGSVIAYEPVWAIGTGESASPEEAEAVHVVLRHRLAELDSELAADMRILYGGSVNAGNAEALFAMENIDGALVGGAALRVEEFTQICQMAVSRVGT